MKKTIDFINHVINKMDYKTYLQIGIEKGQVFNNIKVEKTGVDLHCEMQDVLNISPDEFFENNSNLYDTIFIDGDHRYEEVKKDVINALESITEKGMVLIHDTCPTKSSHVAANKVEGREWCGQAYKVATEYNNKEGYEVLTWAKDFGVTIIFHSSNSTSYDYGYEFEDLISSKYESVNAQNIGIINELLSLYKSSGCKNVIEDTFIDGVKQPKDINLKDYYRLCLPSNRIGRKSDKTLIKELKEAGFNV